METFPFTIADDDFYRPIAAVADTKTEFLVNEVPAGWNRNVSDVWTVYSPAAGFGAEQGWKVHVSAALDRAQHVLNVASAICIEHDVPFKHLRNSVFYIWLHHKLGPRPQGGKFIAAYPADVDSARHLMNALSAALEGERGPHILGDRRYRESSVVAYRYGAFIELPRLWPNGTRELLVRDGSGQLVPDERGLTFTTPAGIRDPFSGGDSAPEDQAAPPEPSHGQRCFESLRFDQALRHSNGGGAYRATERGTGRQLFVKEARARTGLHFDASTMQERLAHEYQMLTEIHGAAPGIVPQPFAHFRYWEHTFLVTELVTGLPLSTWVSENQPIFHVATSAAKQREYHRRCQHIIDQLTTQLTTLHDAGYVFVDVSPNNILIDDDDTLRLIDFETASRIGEPPVLIGTPGYFPEAAREELRRLAQSDPCYLDDYGLAAIAQLLSFGMVHQVVQREPGALRHLRYKVAEIASVPLPEPLWRAATRFAGIAVPSWLPSPEEVATDPRRHLRALRDRTADALLAMADPGARPVFPTVPRGYASNVRSVAYGTAGVAHALRLAGHPVDPAILQDLAGQSLRMRHDTPPGLHSGNAGIAWVLADHGLLDEAAVLLRAAEQHPIASQRATLAEGSAGLALTHLAMYRHDRDDRHLDQAVRLRDAIPDGPELVEALDQGDATGLLHGRPGIALVDHYLYRLTGDERALRRGLRLLRDEAARAVPFPGGGIGFRVSEIDAGLYPYLYRGGAGFALAGARYVNEIDPGDPLAGVIADALIPSRTPSNIYCGLYEGRSGLVFALAEYADLTGSATSLRAAEDVARGLFCYAVPDGGGVRFLGEHLLRFSAELWSGSAGVLLALTRLVDDRRDAFFTVDELVADVAPRRSAQAGAPRSPATAAPAAS